MLGYLQMLLAVNFDFLEMMHQMSCLGSYKLGAAGNTVATYSHCWLRSAHLSSCAANGSGLSARGGRRDVELVFWLACDIVGVTRLLSD